MTILTLLCFLISITQLPSLSSSSQSPLISANEKFLSCFTNTTDPSDNISTILSTKTNTTYTSTLLAYIRNLRYSPLELTPTPEFIITPTKPPQVSLTVSCAKSSGLTVITRSGGHDFEGLSYTSSLSPFLVLDMFNLCAIKIDTATETAYVEAGATLGELYYRISESSTVLGFPAGVCPTVGVGGHISGGGYGNMLRKHGLSVDQVVDAQIVDVNGRILDRKSMGDDLFWAIRGGGGASFGVVLSYTVSLVAVPAAVSVFKVFRFEEDNVTDLVYKWQQFMQDADHGLFIRVLLQPVTGENGGKKKTVRVTFMGLFLGDADRLLDVMKTGFPELGLERTDCSEMSWIQSVLYWSNYDDLTATDALLNRSWSPEYVKRKSDYVVEPISKPGLELLWQKLADLGEPGMVFNPYGGRMKEIGANETPFPHRDGNLFKIQYSISWKEGGKDVESKKLDKIRELYDFMTPYVSKSPRSAYLNYRDLDIGVTHNFTYQECKVFGEKYFGGNFDRLVKVKSRVDGDNFFRNEQSIPPLKSSCERMRMIHVWYFINGVASWLVCNLLWFY